MEAVGTPIREFRCDEQLWGQLVGTAKRRDVSASEALRAAIRAYVGEPAVTAVVSSPRPSEPARVEPEAPARTEDRACVDGFKPRRDNPQRCFNCGRHQAFHR